MNLTVVSYKVCWRDQCDAENYVTVAGFPYQIKLLSQLFDLTNLVIAQRFTAIPDGAKSLHGHNLTFNVIPEPANADWRRKLALIAWLPRYIPAIWRAIILADAVHTPVPGDIGFIGLMIALVQRKPLFVRHCGTWGEPVTKADRALLWLLERVAGGRIVVMATGGGNAPPSARNPHITWIHSTTLAQGELDKIPSKIAWKPGRPLHLASVSRLSAGKNTIDAIRALPQIQAHYPDIVLHIVGDGPERQRLEQAAINLGVAATVVFHGNVEHDEVLRILQQCDVFVFPTKTKEGFPKAVLEALACGLPVVATAVSVLPYLIGTENGITLPDPTPKSVADAVLSLITDEEKFAAMSAHARKTSRQYTLERWQAIIKERLEASWGPLSVDCPR